jgi:cyclophilin family peptidyl-prolyl cis-trans isomerase
MRILILFALVIIISGCLTGEEKIQIEELGNDNTSRLAEASGAGNIKKNPTAKIVTNKGEFTFELFSSRAPATAANFIELARAGFYNGLTFHRYEPGFVIQGGDPQGDGTGGSDKTIDLEIHPELTHVEGGVGMARSSAPNSASSQFYIALAPSHFLDGNYAVFGKVTAGMDVVKSLRAGDKMMEVTIEG